MKTIGMLGGMSWESTAIYYRLINELVRTQLGGLHSARICLYSVDFHEIETLQHRDQWTETAVILSNAAKSIELGGADFLLICTNTMHKVSHQIESKISIPILHIADATAKRLVDCDIDRVGLLGTRFTMEQDFYTGRLINNFGIDVIVPASDERTIVHDIIYNELCQGVIRDDSRNEYLKIIDGLRKRGAQAVILGCTEIALLVNQGQTDVSLFDTTTIHAEEAALFSLDQ